jgi:hypothetical protein
MTSGKPAPVTCTHMADGHSKAVLSVFATEDLLFSSSKGMYTIFHVWQTVILKLYCQYLPLKTYCLLVVKVCMADSHSKVVLSVFATEDLLFTSSNGMYTIFHVWQTVILKLYCQYLPLKTYCLVVVKVCTLPAMCGKSN